MSALPIVSPLGILLTLWAARGALAPLVLLALLWLVAVGRKEERE